MGFIYKLTYKVSRKAYIGQTIRPILKRLDEHQLSNSGCKAIIGAIKNYGWENFDVEWYEIPDEDLNFYEEMLVALLGTLAPGGYNLREGGGNKGKMSAESKQRMSEAKKGEKHPMYSKSHTKETKQKMSEALLGEKHPMYGKTHSKETKQKMSEAHAGEKCYMYGKTHSKETKQKMSEAQSGEKNPMFGKNHIEETKQKMSKALIDEKNINSKKVYQYNLDGTYVNNFGSSGGGARSLGMEDGSSIRACARGDRKSAHGFKWSYTEL